MTQHDAKTNGHAAKLKGREARPGGRLETLGQAEEREVLKAWKSAGDGMDGPRSGVPATPDDQVAHQLVEAAGQAIERGQKQKGINILKLVVRDYRESKEAALARAALDQLEKGKGR
ncbi:hypothetical protein [Paludisphaera borealis]|uniref:hypothetical protein n=1 Tax=Paludisphaera borealis TaxID=1387353 RepID=UPI0009705242|nr:hypothetical protein [Paludisphaera borealis]